MATQSVVPTWHDGDKTPIALFDWEVTRNGYLSNYVHPLITFVYAAEGSPRNLDNMHPLGELRITGQGSSDDEARRIYAMDVEYKPYSVNLAKADQMAKTLRKVQKALDKAHDEMGYAEDWAEFARRVMAALGIKEVWFYRNERTGLRPSRYSDNQYLIEYKLGEATNRIRGIIARWQRRDDETAAAS